MIEKMQIQATKTIAYTIGVKAVIRTEVKNCTPCSQWWL